MAIFGISFFKSDEVSGTSSQRSVENSSPSYIKMVDDELLMPMSDNFKPSQKSINTSVGENILTAFNQEYPELESSTYLAARINYLKRNNGSKEEIQALEKQLEEVDKIAEELITRNIENIGKPDFNELLAKNIKELNVANCGDRASLVQQKLNGMNIANKKVILKSSDPFAEHEFNIIGLDENADISKPETWGENAVIIDTWANKVFDLNTAKDFYSEFFGLGNFNNVQFKEDAE